MDFLNIVVTKELLTSSLDNEERFIAWQPVDRSR